MVLCGACLPSCDSAASFPLTSSNVISLTSDLFNSSVSIFLLSTCLGCLLFWVRLFYLYWFFVSFFTLDSPGSIFTKRLIDSANSGADTLTSNLIIISFTLLFSIQLTLEKLHEFLILVLCYFCATKIVGLLLIDNIINRFW